MAFNEQLRKRVLAKVIKKPRTANEIGSPLGYSGRGIGRVLGELHREGTIVKHPTRPPTYTKG